MKPPKYKKCKPIKSYKTTAWLIEYKNGKKEITVWDKKTKIEDVIKITKLKNPAKTKFTVMPIQSGLFKIRRIGDFIYNENKVNQSLRLISFDKDEYFYKKRN